GRRDRPCARQASRAGRAREGQEPAGRRVRVRPGDRRRHRHAARRGAVRRGGLAPLHRRGAALPGGHHRRRAARGEEVPPRHQPHPRRAGAGRETVKLARRCLLVAVAAALGCAAAPPPGSIDVQYEPVAKPAAPAAATFWTGRTDLIQAPPPPKPEALALPKIDRFSLSNGMQVIVVARKALPVVSFGLAVQAGGYDEDRDNLGVSDFVAAMLRKGTKNDAK